MQKVPEKIKNKIIVSCQAASGEPLYDEKCMLALIKSVVNGGACALRLAGKRDIENTKKEFDIPVIGITKPDPLPDNWKEIVYITPTVKDALSLIRAGADIIAFDGTNRPREKDSLEQIIATIKEHGKLAMADISTLEEGIECVNLGADIISTTLSGYTKETQDKNMEEPDFELLEELVKTINRPIILEGRLWEPTQVKHAFKIGAHAVVIGSAVTRPQLITKRFIEYGSK